jgi:hypothetical protein
LPLGGSQQTTPSITIMISTNNWRRSHLNRPKPTTRKPVSHVSSGLYSGGSNCLGNQVRRDAPAYLEARRPRLTGQNPQLPHSVSQPFDAGSMAHATVRACSECRRDDPRCPTVFEDLDYFGLSRLGCLKTYRERTPN